jgi:hypothetical protein
MTTKIKGNPKGSRIINIVCLVCGKYFSERSGHDCSGRRK